METFAKRLKELRKEKGLSALQLAKNLGISDMTIFRWKNCKADVKGEHLIMLANFFRVSTDYLLGLDDYY